MTVAAKVTAGAVALVLAAGGVWAATAAEGSGDAPQGLAQPSPTASIAPTPPGPTTVTQRTLVLSSRSEAQKVLARVFQDLVGRDPNSAEVGRFAEELHRKQRHHPQVVETTTYPDGSTTVVRSGGYSPEALARKYARKVQREKAAEDQRRHEEAQRQYEEAQREEAAERTRQYEEAQRLKEQLRAERT